MGIGVHGRKRIERYQLPDLWCLHLYRYTATVRLEGREYPIEPGYVGIIPANMSMEYHFPSRSPHLYVHFRCLAGETTDTARPIRAMQDLGDDFGRIYEQLEQVVNSENGRARARLWEVLWQLSERTVIAPGEYAGTHPAVKAALSLIDRHLDEALRVSQIAETVGVSDNYLARLFGASVGVTVVGYIQKRRAERAVHLLRHSTLPVKTIAVLVGLPDLQQFNKAIHAAMGQSPRAVRSAVTGATPDETLRSTAD